MPSRSLPFDPGQMGSGAQPWPRGQQPTASVTPAARESPAQSSSRTHPSGASRRTRRPHNHHPRVRAALCYAVPVVPGWWLLTHERRNPFVRFHAAQSLVFFALVAVGQLALYLLVLLAGGFIADNHQAIVAAGVVVVLYLAFAVTVAVVWLHLLADCIRGAARPLPLAGRLAARLERFAPRASWLRWWNG